jgi:hypothetical protein
MTHLTDTQYKNLSQLIYETLMGATLPCECGAECSLGMGEMGEARDTADGIIDEWMKTNDIQVPEHLED